MDEVLDPTKTTTTIRGRLPENGTTFTKTLFQTGKNYAVMPDSELSNKESEYGWCIEWGE